MRPSVTFLGKELLERIVTEARTVLCQLGVEIHNSGVISLLSDHGAKVRADSSRVLLTDDIIDRARLERQSVLVAGIDARPASNTSFQIDRQFIFFIILNKTNILKLKDNKPIKFFRTIHANFFI